MICAILESQEFVQRIVRNNLWLPDMNVAAERLSVVAPWDRQGLRRIWSNTVFIHYVSEELDVWNEELAFVEIEEKSVFTYLLKDCIQTSIVFLLGFTSDENIV